MFPNDWIDTGFRAILRPNRIMKFDSGTLNPKFTYSIIKQEYEASDPWKILKTTMVGNNEVVTFGYELEEYFEILKVKQRRLR